MESLLEQCLRSRTSGRHPHLPRYDRRYPDYRPPHSWVRFFPLKT